MIERIFGVLRCRYHILNTVLEYDLETQAQLVLVVCALHNFIRHHANGEDDEFYKETDQFVDDRTGNVEVGSFDENEEEGEFGQGQDMRAMVLEGDRRAMKMCIDYVEYK